MKKAKGQVGLFDEENRLEKLSAMGDNLEKLNNIIDFKPIEKQLKNALTKEDKKRVGRPSYDYLMMFKILIIQRLYNLSDDQTEYQINDRRSFMRFVGIHSNDTVPDAKTIWLFRENLIKSGAIEDIFKTFGELLENEGLVSRSGSIVDATFVEAPRQRNSRDENKIIKDGQIPEEWQLPENKKKLQQKDVDARWTKKNNETFYGYKNHAKIDDKSKLIISFLTSSASVHDSKKIEELIDEFDKILYADSAYVGLNIETLIREKNEKIELKIIEKAYKNKPLTDEQKESNKLISKTRVRVEHVFGFMTNSMKGITLRCIGKVRADFNIAITNLIYNFCRYEFLKRPKKITG